MTGGYCQEISGRVIISASQARVFFGGAALVSTQPAMTMKMNKRQSLTGMFLLALTCALLAPLAAQEPGSAIWSEQLVIFADAQNRLGFGDLETGKFIIPPRYEAARPFSDNLAAVMLDGKWGFIDNNGRMVIPARFAAAHSFYGGHAAVRTEREWFLVNREGVRITTPSALDGEKLPGQILADRQMAGINPGYERVMGPDDFRPQAISLPRDESADELARGLIEFERGAANLAMYNYSEARPHFEEAMRILPASAPGHRLASLAIKRIDAIVDSGMVITRPRPVREEDDFDWEEDWEGDFDIDIEEDF